MKTKQERIQEIGENGPFQYRAQFQDYDEKDGWICIDGYYSAQQLRDIANVMDDTTADGHPPEQAAQGELRNSLLRGKAQNEEPRVRHLCNMGVGCEEAGICYAEAHGQPEQCGRPIDAHLAGIGEPVAYCCPDDPFNSTAFSWPGPARVLSRHTMPLYTTPPINLAAVREVIAEVRRCAGNNNAKFHLTWADKLTAALPESKP